MKIEGLNEIIKDQIAYCLNVLQIKGDEYALGDDRLEHFKMAATEQSVTSEQALWGMLSKHITSLSSMCKNVKNRTFSRECWLEKITDSINYLFLLRALIEEDFTNGQD